MERRERRDGEEDCWRVAGGGFRGGSWGPHGPPRLIGIWRSTYTTLQ